MKLDICWMNGTHEVFYNVVNWSINKEDSVFTASYRQREDDEEASVLIIPLSGLRRISIKDGK